MEGCSRCRLPQGKRVWKMYLAVAFGVAVVALAVTVPILLCQPAVDSAMAGNGSARLAWLEKELATTNQSLAEAHGQWESCRKKLGELEEKVSEQDRVLASVTQLQKENRALHAEVAQQQEQLGDLRRSRDELQLQNQLLREQLQDRTQHSGGKGPPAVSLSLLALLLPGMLLL